MLKPLCVVLFVLGATPLTVAVAAPVHHRLDVELTPRDGRVTVVDRFDPGLNPGETSPARTLEFALGSGFQPAQLAGKACAAVETVGTGPAARYRVAYAGAPVTVCVQGRAGTRHAEGDALRGGSGGSRALLNPEGAYLDPSAGWYPQLPGDPLETFDLDVTLPPDWHAVSQGDGSSRDVDGHARWQERHPQQGIFLVAGPWHVYRDAPPNDGDPGNRKAHIGEIYLREPDPDLARRYLAATRDYLATYSALLGDYPYAKFALVENVWESGWGMPSFTLLGSRVIRLPFIVHTSYPHEILHNWWGNGVYVDALRGNWSEGLTTYLADHALAERRGDDADYRRNALTQFARYLSADPAAPGLALADFLGRHDRASQAVGYGKSFMFFHMLRRQLGDAAFVAGLRRFYAEHRFTRAGYPALRAAFEAESGQDLAPMFANWVERADAPALRLDDVQVEPVAGRWRLRGRLRQTQPGAPFPLRVPIAVATRDGRVDRIVPSNRRDTPFEFELDAAPTVLVADPESDVFRRLDPAEIPPALGDAMHAAHIVLVLPRTADGTLREAYRDFAARWAADSPGVDIRWDDDSDAPIPADAAIWYLGATNAQAATLRTALARAGWQPPAADPGDSVALAIPGEHDGDRPRAWLLAENPHALPGLARKLPHYGRYAWLRFTGDAPSNVAKGTWPVTRSPLRIEFEPGATLPAKPGPALLPAASAPN